MWTDLPGARMHIRDLQYHRLAPIAPRNPLRRATGHDHLEPELRLQLKPRRRAFARAVWRRGILQDDALAAHLDPRRVEARASSVTGTRPGRGSGGADELP